MRKFNFLHVHGTYSFLDGYGTAEQYIDTMNELNIDCLALTDHGSTWGHIPFYDKFKKANKKLIFGVEFYYSAVDVAIKNAQRYHITVLAKNYAGFININKMMTIANFEGMYYKPRIDDSILEKHKDGLIVLSGCIGSGFPVGNINNEQVVTEWITKMKGIFNDDFYVEVSPIKHNADKILKVLDLANRLKVKAAVTMDVHFPAKEHHEAEDAILCIGLKEMIDNEYRIKLSSDLHLVSPEKAIDDIERFFGFQQSEDLVYNTNEIAEKCNVEIPKVNPLLFYKDKPEKSAEVKFKKLLDAAMQNKGLLNNKEYVDRLEFEKNIIIEKKFVNYFLIVWDLVNWAKKRMVVGASRGSVGGSLIAFLLDITIVDPIKHRLIFERFIDITRSDLPDIDIDFPHDKRKDVIDYIVAKYGEDNVSLLGTVNYFKGKNTIWDIGRINGNPLFKSKELIDLIDEPANDDSIRKSFSTKDEISEFLTLNNEYKVATYIEGQARQPGVHASAIVLGSDPLHNFGSFANIDGRRVLCMDKEATEKIDLLKLDILALKQLSIIDEILTIIKKPFTWLYAIDLEDSECYEVLNSDRFMGIFQFEGESIKSIAKQIRPKNFNDFQIISTLGRPGNIASGGTADYIKIVKKEKNESYITDKLKVILSETKGIIVYQEQIMEILKTIGNTRIEETNKIRKIISKSRNQEDMTIYGDSFIKNAINNKLTKTQAIKLWEQIVEFSTYTFNKAHSVGYGYISFWTLYLKTHYPEAFFLCTLRHEDDDIKIKLILKEWTVLYNKKFVVLDSNISGINFTLKDGVIYGGFMNIKGFGESVANTIIKYRNVPHVNIFTSKIGKKSFEILKKFNAVPVFNHYQSDLWASDGFKQNQVLKNVDIPYEHAPWSKLFPIDEKKYSKLYEKHNFVTISEIEKIPPGDNIRTLGMILNIKKFDKHVAFTIEDNKDVLAVSVKSEILLQGSVKLEVGKIIFVQGKMFNQKFYAVKIKIPTSEETFA